MRRPIYPPSPAPGQSRCVPTVRWPRALRVWPSRTRPVRTWLTWLLTLCLSAVWLGADARPRPVTAAPIHLAPPGQDNVVLESQASPPLRVTVQPPAPLTAQRSASEPLHVDAVVAEVQRELAQLRATSQSGHTAQAAQAAWLLGLIYLHGAGVPQSAAQAQSWFERAAERPGQHPWALAGVAWCRIEGCQGPPNPDEARAALTQLRATQRGRATFLQWVLQSRHAPIRVASPKGEATERNDRRAQNALLTTAGAAGDVPALVELGIQSAARQDWHGTRRQFEAVAARSPAAKANLERLMALKTRSNASDIGAPAQESTEGRRLFLQAQRLHRGVGNPANYAEAIRLYRQAAARGSQAAKRMLEQIFAKPLPGGGLDVAWMQQLAYLDLSGALPLAASPVHSLQLLRDPSPLFDLLPPIWQARVTARGV